MKINYGTVVTSPEELTEASGDGESIIVLFKQEYWFIKQTIFRSFASQWVELNPEEFGVQNFRYNAEQIFGVAQRDKMTVAVIPLNSLPPYDGQELPVGAILWSADQSVIYSQVTIDSWWDMNEFVGENDIPDFTTKNLNEYYSDLHIVWALEPDEV